MACLSCLAGPFVGLCRRVLGLLTLGVHDTQFAHGCQVVLHGRLAEPFERLALVPVDDDSVIEEDPDAELGVRMPQTGCRKEEGKGVLHILAFECSHSTFVVGFGGRFV